MRQKEPWEHPDTADAENRLHWNCFSQGCFNHKKRPKIEMLARCLPGRLQFSDIDAEAEVNWNWLRLEWKSCGGTALVGGQDINYKRLTGFSPRNVVLVVWGDAETMEVYQVGLYEGGRCETDFAVVRSLDKLRLIISDWATWAKAQPAPAQEVWKPGAYMPWKQWRQERWIKSL